MRVVRDLGVALVALLGCAGCGDGDDGANGGEAGCGTPIDGAPTLTIATGGFFRVVEDGQDFPVTTDRQFNALHFSMSAGVTGIIPGTDPTNPNDECNPEVVFQAFDADDEPVCLEIRRNLGFEPYREVYKLAASPQSLFVAGGISADDLYGQPIRLYAEVTDIEGTTASAEVTVIPFENDISESLFPELRVPDPDAATQEPAESGIDDEIN